LGSCDDGDIDVNIAAQSGEPWAAALEELRDFYEKLPYPAPVPSLDDNREQYRDPKRRRALFHRIWPAEKPSDRQEILIAGCGTSQAARHALREPEARITAIDLSETSLRHTGELKEKYALKNLELHQLPLERAGELGRSFDLIVCTGVLHHLPDPDRGLRALRDVLNPNGALQLMVYAAYGRAGIYMLQEYCRMLGLGTAASDLSDLGALLEALPGDHPMAALLGRAKDFRHPDAMADALLHPRDRAYTVPQLYAWLERCGMSFGRWMEQAPYLPQCGAMAATPHAERLSALPEPEQHAAAELFRGTFTQHRLIVRRSDAPGAKSAIRFTGEAWREYVPIRLPWARCIHDRAPPGFVAVLLNPAHGHRDLLLPINAWQERLLSAIDGERSLGDIVREHESRGGAHRALPFFHRLWCYDQIVVDASRAGMAP
jgi:SAM-dependent methyltransferase